MNTVWIYLNVFPFYIWNTWSFYIYIGGLFLGFLFCASGLFVYPSSFQKISYSPFSPRSNLAISRDIFWQSQLREQGATGIWCKEDRDAAKNSTIHRTATPPQQRIIMSKMSIVSLLTICSLFLCSHDYCCFTFFFHISFPSSF